MPLQLHLTISPHTNQLECLSGQVGVPVVNNRLEYPATVGKGFLQGYFFPAQLSLYYYYAERLRPLAFQTVNPADSGMYCLFITLSPEALEKTVGEETHRLGRYAPESIFCYAPGNTIYQQFKGAGPRQFLVITFTKATFNYLLPGTLLEQVLPPGGNFLFLDLDGEMERLAGQLIEAGESAFASLNRYGHTLGLLSLIMQKVLSRKNSSGTRGMLEPDIQRLFRVRQHLLEHLSRTVSIKELTRLAGFSETKLKRLFPQLFGTSVYHYHQVARMEKAKELLSSRRYSVSEVGYLVGYTNLTHFANAFARHHGLKPGQYLQTIKGGNRIAG